MTREEEQTFNRYVRLIHAGPEHVQAQELEGVVVEVTESQLYIMNPRRPHDEPRGWHLASICEARAVHDAATQGNGGS